MCLTVITGDLGAAHLGLDVQRLVMVLSTRLDDTQRVYLARRALANAGQEQPSGWAAGLVICLCGLALDLTLPVADFPGRRAIMARIVPQMRPMLPSEMVGLDPDDDRELQGATTGGFPAIQDGMPPPY